MVTYVIEELQKRKLLIRHTVWVNDHGKNWSPVHFEKLIDAIFYLVIPILFTLLGLVTS